MCVNQADNDHPSNEPLVNRRALKRKDGFESVLIVGAGSGGRILATELQDVSRWKLHPVAFVDDDADLHGELVNGIPVLGDSNAIPAIARSEDIDVIVLAIPSLTEAAMRRLVELSKSSGKKLLSMPPIGSILTGAVGITALNPVRSVDVLGRPVVEPDYDSCIQFVRGRRVLVTGAAGSIGAELATQIARLDPSSLVLMDVDESGLHNLALAISKESPELELVSILNSIADVTRTRAAFEQYRPEIVLHAAAYKHVPAMERQPDVAIETNVIGTRNVVTAAADYGAERFVMVSTDKAVRPTSVMGASKRLAELEVLLVGETRDLSVCNVRFGNVLGSRGSVIPTFEKQIQDGGPVTVTDARMKRYFMTIGEAASLIIQAGAYGHKNVTYILDMGEEVSIVSLARRVIELHGLRPDIDIAIEYTGIRPGEKLYEELSLDFENAHPTLHPKIRMLDGSLHAMSWDEFTARVEELRTGTREEILNLVSIVDGIEVEPRPTETARS